MFSIEHEFDHTAVTLVDEGDLPLNEDVIVRSYEDEITVEQVDEITGEVHVITLTLTQMRDLVAAINRPEGVYQRSD